MRSTDCPPEGTFCRWPTLTVISTLRRPIACGERRGNPTADCGTWSPSTSATVCVLGTSVLETVLCVLGTDPNRNFGYGWGTGGSSANPCSATYR